MPVIPTWTLFDGYEYHEAAQLQLEPTRTLPCDDVAAARGSVEALEGAQAPQERPCHRLVCLPVPFIIPSMARVSRLFCSMPTLTTAKILQQLYLRSITGRANERNLRRDRHRRRP